MWLELNHSPTYTGSVSAPVRVHVAVDEGVTQKRGEVVALRTDNILREVCDTICI